MFDPAHLVLAIVVISIAAFLQGFSGFGINLFAVPILVHFGDIHSVVPMCILVAGFNSFSLLYANRNAISLKTAFPVLLTTVIGAPVGVVFLSHLNPILACRFLGFTIIATVLAQAFISKSILGKPTPLKAGIAGLAGGVLGGAFGTAGPPIAFYIHVTCEPLLARTTLYLIFGITGIVAMTGHIFAGHAGSAVIITGLILAPFAVVFGILGGWIAVKVKPEPFRKMVFGLLGLLGVMLIIR